MGHLDNIPEGNWDLRNYGVPVTSRNNLIFEKKKTCHITATFVIIWGLADCPLCDDFEAPVAKIQMRHSGNSGKSGHSKIRGTEKIQEIQKFSKIMKIQKIMKILKISKIMKFLEIRKILKILNIFKTLRIRVADYVTD